MQRAGFAKWMICLLVLARWCVGAEPPRPVVSIPFDEAKGNVVRNTALTAGEGRISRGQAGPAWVPGTRGSAIWFFGDPGQGVTMPHRAEMNLTDELTIDAWIWPSRLGEFQTILWKGDRRGAIDKVNYRLSLRPEGTLELTFKGPADEWYQVASRKPMAVGQWSHVAATFKEGNGQLYVNGRCVADSRMNVYTPRGGKVKVWHGDRMLPNDASLEIGACQAPSGEPGQCFRGAIDEIHIWPRVLPAIQYASPPDVDPFATLVAWKHELTAAEVQAKPYLVGRVQGKDVPWELSVEYPGREDRGARVAGMCSPDGQFRYLLDEYCGPIELRGASRMKVSIYRTGTGAGSLTVEDVHLEPGRLEGSIVVDPQKKFQQIRGFGCYADVPNTFLSDPVEQDAQYAPLLAMLEEIGVTHLDFSTPVRDLEPENDDTDPRHINWNCFRETFRASSRLQVLAKYLCYLQSKGFTVGLRVISYARWQCRDESDGPTPDTDEVAEYCVALLKLMIEAGVKPTHLVPVWEVKYAPESVAEICVKTARLARQHGIGVPIVGPYCYATGGQSTNMEAMPDRYMQGKLYVGAYLKTAGDVCDFIGVEDYASGCALIEPNLKRLWREVIEPGNRSGRPKELWMLEYGSPCGPGPWNFYPSRWHGTYATYESAFRLARCLHQQLNGGVSNFLFWKAYDVVGDGNLISCCGLIKSAIYDYEPRPPYYVARMFWKHIPPGARHIACQSDGALLANAFEKHGSFSVVMTNPRSDSIKANLRILGTELAPQAWLYTSTEEVKYQQCQMLATGPTVSSLLLPPRSVSTVVCRRAHVTQPFDRTVWADESPGVVYLSDLQWAGVSVTGTQGLRRSPLMIDGRNVSVRQDETNRHEWLVIDRTRYRKGLGAMAPSQVVYELDGRAVSFKAVVGLDDAAAHLKGTQRAIFEVMVDGKTVFTSSPMSLGKKRKVSVPCTGAKELRLIVKRPEGSSANTPANWAEARLVPQGP